MDFSTSIEEGVCGLSIYFSYASLVKFQYF